MSEPRQTVAEKCDLAAGIHRGTCDLCVGRCCEGGYFGQDHDCRKSAPADRSAEDALRGINDNPRGREHSESRADGWSEWHCVPVADAIEAVFALSPPRRTRRRRRLGTG